jgi:PAS domain S-box-containing protein
MEASPHNPARLLDDAPGLALDIVNTLREPLLVLDAQLRVTAASRSFYKTFKVAPDATIGRRVYELGDGQWDIPGLRTLLEDLLPPPPDGYFDGYPVTHDFPGVGRREMLLNARRLPSVGEVKLILLAIEDVTDRCKAERELVRSEGLRGLALESADLGTWHVDGPSMNLTTDDRFRRMFCGNGAPLTFDEAVACIHPDDQQRVRDAVSAAMQPQDPAAYSIYYRVVHADGAIRWVYAAGRGNFDGHDGERVLASFDGTVLDVTDRVAAEEVQRRRTQQFEAMLNAAPFRIYLVDEDFRIRLMNVAARPVFGEIPDVIGRDFDEVIHILWAKEIADEIVRLFRHTLDTGETYANSEFIQNRSDRGVPEYYQWQIQRITMPDGRFCVACYFEDISQRVLARQAMEASELRYRRLFETAHDGILILDVADRKITDVNPFMLELLGYPAAHFIGLEMWEIGLLKDRAESEAVMQTLHETGAIRYHNKPLQDRNGWRKPVEIVANIYQEDDHPVIQCNIRDISERERNEAERAAHLINEQSLRMEAEAANRSKDIFLATLSHELRTPLNAIVGWVSILSMGKASEEDLTEGLGAISRSTKAQVQLIDDVLDVSRIISGKLRMEIRAAELVSIVHAAIEVVQSAADAKGIRIDAQLDPDASAGSCDSTRIQQVVWNLLSNAIKFTPKGGTVTITLARQQSMSRITVSDTGTGMSAEFLPFVFDRFRQADGSTTRKFGGLGLGLSIVKQLVELHGGTVRAGSAGEGKGATFTVDLPIRAVGPPASDESSHGGTAAASEWETPGARRGTQAPVRLDAPPLRVMVVDDEADARRVVAKVLTDAGALVTAVGSVAEALHAIEVVKPQVLVSDIAMPDEDGYDLIRQVRALGASYTAQQLPAVALTAFAAKGYARSALLAGFQVHLPKPVDPLDLIATVASLAGRTGQ